jgi:hypothetical protein
MVRATPDEKALPPHGRTWHRWRRQGRKRTPRTACRVGSAHYQNLYVALAAKVRPSGFV